MGISHGTDTPVAFMFPGVGSQYIGMAKDLYRSEPVFHAEFDACAEAFIPHIGLDIRDLVYPNIHDDVAKDALAETMNTQPVMFAIELALARLLMSWGIQPNGMIGHSIGEYTAACLAGVFSLDDLGVIAERARVIQQQPHGAMMAVRLDADDVSPMLGADISIAAYNAPKLTVVSGTEPAVANLEASLVGNGTWCKRVETCHAFHSPMMDGAVAPFAQALSQVQFREPTARWISCLTGDWITGQQATSINYWTQQMRQAVRFSDGVQRLLCNEEQLLLEVGPGGALTTFVRQHRQFNANQRVLLTIGNIAGREVRSILEAVAHMWVKGVTVDWAAMRSHEARRHVPLPTYPFERKRHWIDPPKLDALSAATPAIAGPTLTRRRAGRHLAGLRPAVQRFGDSAERHRRLRILPRTWPRFPAAHPARGCHRTPVRRRNHTAAAVERIRHARKARPPAGRDRTRRRPVRDRGGAKAAHRAARTERRNPSLLRPAPPVVHGSPRRRQRHLRHPARRAPARTPRSRRSCRRVW